MTKSRIKKIGKYYKINAINTIYVHMPFNIYIYIYRMFIAE
jgi:hypothetical protein